MQIDNCSQCEDCIYGSISGTKAKLIVHCDYRDCDYIFGQYVKCDQKQHRKDDLECSEE